MEYFQLIGLAALEQALIAAHLPGQIGGGGEDPASDDVGNLNLNTTEDGLRDAFDAFGAVSSVHLVTDRNRDRNRGQPRNFGFIEMDDANAVQGAIDGRTLTVNEAGPRPERGNDRGGGDRW